MKARVEVIGLETIGDRVIIKGQGSVEREAEWLPLGVFTFSVPVYRARAYRVGDILKVRISR